MTLGQERPTNRTSADVHAAPCPTVSTELCVPKYLDLDPNRIGLSTDLLSGVGFASLRRTIFRHLLLLLLLLMMCRRPAARCLLLVSPLFIHLLKTVEHEQLTSRAVSEINRSESSDHYNLPF
ncbi:hypothetical protein TNCV_3589981 [Trichonephila clavipes]|nr:hypothetical protein TNCV_3589981 [Trichonephila clavipes]